MRKEMTDNERTGNGSKDHADDNKHLGINKWINEQQTHGSTD